MICFLIMFAELFCKTFGIDFEMVADGNAFGFLMLLEIAFEFVGVLFWTMRS